MKTIYRISVSLLCMLAMTLGSCSDSAFDELNTNPAKSPDTDPNYQLSQCEAQVWGYWIWQETALKYAMPFCQYLMGDWGVTNYGGHYLKDDKYMGYIYEQMYPMTVKNLVDIIDHTRESDQRNLYYMARVFKVFVSGIITDLYGDVPYTEAGRGYINGIVQPKFDRQEDIYKDFMNELQVANDSLDENQPLKVTGDLIYNGNVSLWKKLANALHLRYAMRMVNVAPDLAKEEASKALHNSGGLIASDKEEALVRYVYDSFDWTNDEYRRNGLSQLMRGREDHPTMYICSTFFNYLGKTKDPRQFVYCRNYDQSSPNKPFGRADITDEMINTPKAKFQPVDPGYFHYEKWPSGYWSKQVKKYLMKECRPQINNIFLKLTSPGVIMTAAETKLLEAEAVARWGSEMSSETVEKLYAQGVKAAFHFLENYGADAFKDRDIDRYIRHNNVSTDLDDQLEKINTQLWILHFNNPWEGYANWRRSGYPILKPSPDYGAKCIDSQTTPLRLCYPIFESSYNRVHYNEAIDRMGGTDDWNKPVWWDQ